MNTTYDVHLAGVTHRFGSTTALSDVTATIRADTIVGLIGRNGAGKSTLARLVAAYDRCQQGTVEVGGQPVWENPDRTSRVYLARHRAVRAEDPPVRATRALHRLTRPQWDDAYFERLSTRFGVPHRRTTRAMSVGQQASLWASFALASRAEVTILDEIHLGMDAVSRRFLYEEILADYAEHPRTFILSSHLVDEIEPLVEDVIVLDRGRVVAAGDADDVRSAHSTPGHLASLTDVLVDLSERAQS